MKNYYVFDTSSLILEAYTLFEDYKNIIIPSICLSELEYIKTGRFYRIIKKLKSFKRG